jgi:hypothetical protein
MTNETLITDPLQIVEEINRRFAARQDWALDTPDQLPPLKAEDGFTVSVQASEYHYCTPRQNKGPYTHVECGYPSELPVAWADWAEAPDTTKTVFPYIPIIEVAREFARRGGLV